MGAIFHGKLSSAWGVAGVSGFFPYLLNKSGREKDFQVMGLSQLLPAFR